MKITAFILSILLSTAALAENQAVSIQHSDVNIIEMRAQIEDAIEDGRIRVMKMKADEAVEWVKEQFDRGDITEEQKGHMIRSIHSIEAAHHEADQNNILEHIGKACLECKRNAGRLFLGSSSVIGTIAGMLLASLGPPPFVGGPATTALLIVIGGTVIGVSLGAALKFFGMNDNICAEVCAFSSGDETQK